METIETILSKESNFDHKNILNRFDKKIDQNILNQIEKGITLENLQELTKNKIPVFKYRTQITIHGLFPELSNNYIFGYKNVFQNKNKSIGIKYNAIDEQKRIKIAEKLKYIGFHYSRNSTDTNFMLTSEILTAENFQRLKSEYTEVYNRIDKSLFFGYCNLFIGQIFGAKYLCLSININAILEKNVNLFIEKMGVTDELIKRIENEKRKENEIWQKRYEAEKQKEREIREQNLLNAKDQIDILEKFERVEKTDKPGNYILKYFNSKNELQFKFVALYLPKGKKIIRKHEQYFNTVNEALNYKFDPYWNDSIFKGRLTGYKIN